MIASILNLPGWPSLMTRFCLVQPLIYEAHLASSDTQMRWKTDATDLYPLQQLGDVSLLHQAVLFQVIVLIQRSDSDGLAQYTTISCAHVYAQVGMNSFLSRQIQLWSQACEQCVQGGRHVGKA